MKMVRRIFIRVLFLLAIYGFTGGSPALAQNFPLNLTGVVHDASAIIVGRLQSVLGSDGQDVSLIPASADTFMKGEYKFNVDRVIKGPVIATVSVSVDTASIIFYNATMPEAVVGEDYLLFLQPNSSGGWQIAFRLIPFIELGKYSDTTKTDGGDITEAVGLALSDSFAVARTKHANAGFLDRFIDPSLIPTISVYKDDTDIFVQDAALSFLATNQVVSVIPLIACLERSQEKRNSGATCVMALHYFEGSKAVELLNPLVLESSETTRINTALGLWRMLPKDPKSTPYMMLALDDTGDSIPHLACETLHAIFPDMGPSDEYDYFMSHKAAEVNGLYTWWSELLEGEPVAGASEYDTAIEDEVKNQHKPIMGLFSTVRTERVATVSRFILSNDRSNIPYYVLALRDPDPSIAYSAYTCLTRLLPKLIETLTKSGYISHREKENSVVLRLWQSYLNGDTRLDLDPT